jgi:hypothetical protein
MCDPLSAAAVLTVGSIAANQVAANKVTGARNSRMAAEALRQKGYQQDANLINAEAQQGQAADQQKQNIATEQVSRERALAPAADVGTELPTSGSAPIEVKGAIAEQMADALGKARQQIGAQARLGAYGANQFNNSLALNRAQSDLGTVQNFSQGSSSILPFELEAANQAGSGWRTAADLMRLGGTAAGLYGLTAMAPAAAGASLATPATTVPSLSSAAGLSGATPMTLGAGVPAVGTAAGFSGLSPLTGLFATRVPPMYAGIR